MRIVIVIHSQSGHTANVARSVASALRDKGHDVDIDLLRAVGKVHSGATNFELRNIPDISSYDAIIVGCPVWGFAASPVMMKFLQASFSCKGKKILPFVTMGFPFAFLGGTRAIRRMVDALSLSGAALLDGEVIPYGFGLSAAKMSAVTNRIVSRLLE
jgi:flavodoxin